MKLILDVENTVTKRDGKMHLDPFEPDNSLVMVGILPVDVDGQPRIYTFDHAELEPTFNGKEELQLNLDRTTLLIGHNIAYDLLWLWESGFKYDGEVYDTMLNEYILQRGVKEPLTLEACAERCGATPKSDTLKEYFAKGYSTRDIPHAELCEYLRVDLYATRDVFHSLMRRYNQADNAGLRDTAELTDQVAVCLAKIYQRGFAVDLHKLQEVRDEFELEKNQIEKSLTQQTRELMGDIPINLNSPEQLSWIIYSRKPHDKTMWGNSFDPYMSDEDFRNVIQSKSSVVYKQRAIRCQTCYGTGYTRKIKKDGTPFAKPNRCVLCNAIGYQFIDTDPPAVAGLKFSPPNPKWASANGFTTSKTNLEILEKVARSRGMKDAELFLQRVRRLSALDTYLSSFIDGIQTHTKQDGKLHVRLLQHRTATGRFSGADPNMQNMPRGGTFPVKKVFVSRWEDGQILEADFAQLEFRVAAYLGQDATAIEEVKTGFDVHSYTAEVITKAGQIISRQDAKAHTFAPLYGASGYGRTPAEAKYYKQFNEKYKGIASWHKRLATEALNKGKIKTPSGREFAFPDMIRKRNGVSHYTQLKNYPVQSLATADIVPVALLHIDSKLDNMESCIVNTVHDSIVIDVHPNEKGKVLNIINETNNELNKLIESRWNIVFNVPLLLESKIGNNWLDTKDVA
ncbi:MAG: hypothetical protein CBD97_00305 [Pelagibacteraceae bacterium TMED237]|nr:MAG: hypothetical protein CBD97_00305 [Pelagibacteraceae bacterium TMED237]|tara:strand:+ start:1035 stop:3083 length:2049 start_codon:yes stop_codon:yes gene_type:complete